MASTLPPGTQSQLILPAPIKYGKLQQLASARNPLQEHYTTCLESLAFVAECQARWNDGERVEELEESTRELIDAQHDGQNIKDAIAALATEHSSGLVSAADTGTLILERTEVGKSMYRLLPPVQRYARVPVYEDFRRRVFDVQFPEDEYPGTESFFTRRARGGTGEDEEEEEEMTYRAKRNLKCPITMTTFQHPMRSTVCVHIYSRDAVLEMLRRYAGVIDCPVAGCDKKITNGTIERDRAMERRVHEEEEEEGREGEELSSEAEGSDVLDVFE